MEQSLGRCIVSILVLLHCGNMKGTLQPLAILLPCLCSTIILPLATISPPGEAPVCDGGQLELICTTTGSHLERRFNVICENTTTAFEISHVIQTARPTSATMSQQVVNSTVFNFSRISAEGASPLVSRLLISPVSNGLNGTVINCEDLDTSELSSLLSSSERQIHYRV